MDECTRVIEEASGYSKLSMWEESLEALDRLPCSSQVLLEAQGLRLLACTALARWEEGRASASCLATSGEMKELSRVIVGRFHLCDALAQAAAGDSVAARMALGRLCVVWPEGKVEALEDWGLAQIWSRWEKL